MARSWILCVGAVILIPVALAWRHAQTVSGDPLVEFKPKPPEAAPMCPWREPSSDLKLLFPSATRYAVETRILSGLRPELTQRLGRAPQSDENALHLYRVFKEATPLGFVLVRRVKGDYGAIEMVLATGLDKRVVGWRLQRTREPESVVAALSDPAWRSSFAGKGPDSPWRLGEDVPRVPPEARASAEAVVDGARSLLILLDASEQAYSRELAGAHHP